MGQKCSSGYVKVDGSPYTNRGQGGGDPRFGGQGSSGGGPALDSDKCVPIPYVTPNNSQFQAGAGTTSSNVFDTTANRLGFISPMHT